jgi:hypothetical protein
MTSLQFIDTYYYVHMHGLDYYSTRVLLYPSSGVQKMFVAVMLFERTRELVCIRTSPAVECAYNNYYSFVLFHRRVRSPRNCTGLTKSRCVVNPTVSLSSRRTLPRS